MAARINGTDVDTQHLVGGEPVAMPTQESHSSHLQGVTNPVFMKPEPRAEFSIASSHAADISGTESKLPDASADFSPSIFDQTLSQLHCMESETSVPMDVTGSGVSCSVYSQSSLKQQSFLRNIRVIFSLEFFQVSLTQPMGLTATSAR